jgi:hypothetical protein
VRSIAESLFTFRIIGLLRDPLVVNGRVENYPLHRTSLWSGVYGRTNFIRFDDYFESWRPRSALATSIARLTFIVALFPAALLLFGAYGAMARMVSHAGRVRPNEWMIGITAPATLRFIALALRYRDYSFFKPIHAFAGLLAFLTLFGCACDRFYSKFDGRPAVRAGNILLGALIVLYALDCTLLAIQLFQSCRGA